MKESVSSLKEKQHNTFKLPAST